MKDQRMYRRSEVKLPAMLFVGDSCMEVVCNIRDISERGISFETILDDENRKRFHVGESLKFQFMDVFRFGEEKETNLLTKRCLIRHITEEEDHLIVGCYLADTEFAHYVMHREVVDIIRAQKEKGV